MIPHQILYCWIQHFYSATSKLVVSFSFFNYHHLLATMAVGGTTILPNLLH